MASRCQTTQKAQLESKKMKHIKKVQLLFLSKASNQAKMGQKQLRNHRINQRLTLAPHKNDEQIHGVTY